MAWNDDPNVSAILIQAPLPKHINAQNVFDHIDPRKDVDGFGRENIARLYAGDLDGMIPGTPQGIMHIIRTHRAMISGTHAVVIGKSMVVGKPLTMLLLEAGATVTLCHSRTNDLKKYTLPADIIIVATGKKNLITEDMISPGSLVIDVGITVEDYDTGRVIHGDCDTKNIAKIADITPVPG